MINKNNGELDPTNELSTLESLKEQHIKKFGVKPVIIGINWNNESAILEGVLNALESGIPYDEHNLLSKEDREAFKNGNLFF